MCIRKTSCVMYSIRTYNVVPSTQCRKKYPVTVMLLFIVSLHNCYQNQQGGPKCGTRSALDSLFLTIRVETDPPVRDSPICGEGTRGVRQARIQEGRRQKAEGRLPGQANRASQTIKVVFRRQAGSTCTWSQQFRKTL